MKKILISFLMIAMITGCNQVIEVDKPKDPTIDEHTEISDELDKTLIRKKFKESTCMMTFILNTIVPLILIIKNRY